MRDGCTWSFIIVERSRFIAFGVAGVLIPFGMKRLKLDPALASSIFLTTVTDVAGFFFFLALAALILKSTGL